MPKLPFMQFYPSDWLLDTRSLSTEEKGIWIDLLCFMWNQKKRGFLIGQMSDLARMVGQEEEAFGLALFKIKQKGVCDLKVGEAKNEKYPEITVICRRMVKEQNTYINNTLRMYRWKKANEKRNNNAKTTAKKSEVISQTSEVTKEPPNPLKGNFVIPEDLLLNTQEIKDWLEYKKQKGQSYKPKGLEALWRSFRAIPVEKRREAVDHSMSNNWSGLFEKRSQQNGQQGTYAKSKIGEPERADSKFAGITKIVKIDG